jgi:hypothetical protein
MADILHKNLIFRRTAEWNVLFFGYVTALFYCKKFVASPEKSKWRLNHIQDGVENVYIFLVEIEMWWLDTYIFHPIFSKMRFLSVFFLFFFYILGKNKTFMDFFFSKFKIRNNLIWKMIFFKKIQDFIIAQPLN